MPYQCFTKKYYFEVLQMYKNSTHSLSTVKHSTPGGRAITFAVLRSSLKYRIKHTCISFDKRS